MKNILIVTPTLQNGGGVIRSLQNFLMRIPDNKYSIDVLATNYSSCDIVDLQRCRILKGNFIINGITSVYNQTKGCKYRYLLLLIKLMLKCFDFIGIRETFEDSVFKKIGKAYSNYDLVIAFQEGSTTKFVSYIKSRTKIAWIHCDYKERYKLIKKSEFGIYNSYDLIISVSKYTKDNFDSIYPKLSYKSDFIYNFLDTEYILHSSKEDVKDLNLDSSKIILISIGRICDVKQFHIIPKIISEILNNGITSFKWILMGVVDDEKELNKIQSEVTKYNISSDNFEYIGKRNNPYPYILNSDVLVSTSKSEACPFVVNEARVLNVPVVANNYPSIKEFIQDGKNGYITSVDTMSNCLTELISDKHKIDILKQYTILHPFTNHECIKKFYRILDM